MREDFLYMGCEMKQKIRNQKYRETFRNCAYLCKFSLKSVALIYIPVNYFRII